MTEQVAFIRVGGNPTGEEIGELKAALDNELPEEWGVVVYTGDVEFVDAETAARELRDAAEHLEEEHRLAGADHREEPELAEPAEQPGPVDEDGIGVLPEGEHGE